LHAICPARTSQNDRRTDFAEANDLAGTDPEKLEELKALWWEEARTYGILPLRAL